MSGIESLREANRFADSYLRLGHGLTPLALGAIHDFVRKARSEPETFLQRYDRLKGARFGTVLELEVAGGPRMLVHFESGRVVLLDVGEHDVVRRYPMGSLKHD